MESKVIAIICARGGSKGLKRKNILTINGEPLISRTIRHATESCCIDDIIVTTDDEEIRLIATNAGAQAPFLRPKYLSQDDSTTEETLQHALITYEALTSKKYDICVFLSVCEIFRNPIWIADCVNKLKQDSSLESVFVGYKTTKNFWELNEDNNWERVRPWMSLYSSRQIRRSIVREDTGLACASRSYLWREGRRIGDKIEVILNNDDFSFIDIHSEEDLALAEAGLRIREN